MSAVDSFALSSAYCDKYRCEQEGLGDSQGRVKWLGELILLQGAALSFEIWELLLCRLHLPTPMSYYDFDVM